MTEPKIDWTKPVEYVDDRGTMFPARVLCTDMKSGAPVLALVTTDGGDPTERACYFRENGTQLHVRARLRNVYEKHEGWINIYAENSHNALRRGGQVYDSREQAAKFAENNALATTRIEWSEPAK